jgi:hypothetical protein
MSRIRRAILDVIDRPNCMRFQKPFAAKVTGGKRVGGLSVPKAPSGRVFLPEGLENASVMKREVA